MTDNNDEDARWHDLDEHWHIDAKSGLDDAFIVALIVVASATVVVIGFAAWWVMS